MLWWAMESKKGNWVMGWIAILIVLVAPVAATEIEPEPFITQDKIKVHLQNIEKQISKYTLVLSECLRLVLGSMDINPYTFILLVVVICVVALITNSGQAGAVAGMGKVGVYIMIILFLGYLWLHGS